MPGPQQPAGRPGAALGLFRGKESQRLDSSQQVSLLRLFTWSRLGAEAHVCFSNLIVLDWFLSLFFTVEHYFESLTISLCRSLKIRWLNVKLFLVSHCFSVSVPRFRASTLSNAVSSLANTGISFTRVDEREKQAALEEEQARLKALKVRFP